MNKYKIIIPQIFIIGFMILGIGGAYTQKINQQYITGKVVDISNYPLYDVEILVRDSSLSIKKRYKTDLDGRFYTDIDLDYMKNCSISFNLKNYLTKTLDYADLYSKDNAEVNIILDSKYDNPKEDEMQEVIVKASKKSSSINTSITLQKNINGITQIIGSEFIKKLPDRNMAEILKRMPGTSLQDGKYVIIRGLSDRYNQVILNGVLMSSTEPDRKVFSFNIFPSSMIENIIISKSFTAENSGDVAGGILNIETKDIPSKNFLTLQAGTGLNSEVMGKEFFINKGGKLEWLGLDDGTRSLKNNFPSKEEMFKMNVTQKNEAGKQIYNNWSTEKIVAPIFYNFQLSTGFKKHINDNILGIVYALFYNQRNVIQSFERNIYEFSSLDNPNMVINNDNERYINSIDLASMLNFNLKIKNNSKINFKNIASILSSNSTLNRVGFDANNSSNTIGHEFKYSSNNFYSGQLNFENNFPSQNIKISTVIGYTFLYQMIPGQKRVNYQNDTINNGKTYFLEVLPTSIIPSSAFNFYSALRDDVYLSKVDITKKYSVNNYNNILKFGVLFQYKNRSYTARPFGYKTKSEDLRKIQDLNSLFSHDNWGSRKNNLKFDELSDKQYLYTSDYYLYSSYLQSENQFSENFKVTLGARIEHFDQLLNGYNGNSLVPVPLIKTNILPSINITYIADKKTNIRLAYSQTVARPEFRETAPFSFYDFELNASVAGNSKLKITEIKNFDLRYEFYPNAGEILNVGFFIKLFNNPIEQYFNDNGPTARSFNYLNADKGIGYGFESEFRKKLEHVIFLKDFTLWGNFSYLYNKIVSKTAKIDRPIQGLSPYIINFGLQHEYQKIGLTTNILFNMIGKRILYVGGENIPNIWEAPRPLIDIQLSKKILKTMVIQLNITDILNQKAIFYHDINNNGDFEHGIDAVSIKRKNGTNISISLSYNIF